MKNALSYFIHASDKTSNDGVRKAIFFISVNLLALVVGITGLLQMINESGWTNLDVLFANLAGMVVSVVLLFVYRKWGRRVLWLNVIIATVFINLTISIYLKTGGIYSSDLLWLITTSASVYLGANRASGHFWFTLSLLVLLLFFCMELNGVKNFRADSDRMGLAYNFINLFGCAVFLFVVLIIHQVNNEKNLAEINGQKREIQQKQKEILDSIRYARRIQNALMISEKNIDKELRRLNRL